MYPKDIPNKTGKLGKPQKSKKQKKLKQTFDNDFLRRGMGEKASNLKNLCPEREDYQEVPRKVKQIMKNQHKLKSLNRKKEKKKFKNQRRLGENFHMERGMSRPLKPAPKFVQGKKENDSDFMHRVELETQRVLMEAHIEEKYKVELTGQPEKPYVKKKKSERKREKNKERKKKKVQAMKEKRLERQGDFSQFTDDVQFGEVAMQPPSLTAKPRKAIEAGNKPRPGKRSLLLNQLVSGGTSNERLSKHNTSDNKTRIRVERQAGKTVKRKLLSPAQQRITDSQRQRAIDLYRKMKDQRIKPR